MKPLDLDSLKKGDKIEVQGDVYIVEMVEPGQEGKEGETEEPKTFTSVMLSKEGIPFKEKRFELKQYSMDKMTVFAELFFLDGDDVTIL